MSARRADSEASGNGAGAKETEHSEQQRDWPHEIPATRTSESRGEGEPDTQDQTASESDQTLADRDQTASDRDQTASDQDQAASDLDQSAADRDQAVSDGVATEPDAVELERSRHAREQASGEREEASRSREGSAQERELTSSTRDRIADERDRVAAERDRVAQLRDELADARDASLADPRGYEAGRGEGVSSADRLRLDRDRKRAAAQRAVAAQDRERAALDRRHALEDREHAASERTRAGFDALTGALRRGEGLVALEREVERAARIGEPLALAFVDVDGLKGVNDTAGHGAGDALLRTVALQLRLHIRPYDLVVRLGGDEFLCALPGANTDALRRLLEEVSVQLAEDSSERSISVGFAELGPGDSLEALIKRADADWREKHAGRGARAGFEPFS